MVQFCKKYAHRGVPQYLDLCQLDPPFSLLPTSCSQPRRQPMSSQVPTLSPRTEQLGSDNHGPGFVDIDVVGVTKDRGVALRACRSHRWSAIHAWIVHVDLRVRLSSLPSATLPRVDQGAWLVTCSLPVDKSRRVIRRRPYGSQIHYRDWRAEQNSCPPGAHTTAME